MSSVTDRLSRYRWLNGVNGGYERISWGRGNHAAREGGVQEFCDTPSEQLKVVKTDASRRVLSHVVPVLGWGVYYATFPAILAGLGEAAPAIAYLIVALAAWLGGMRMGVLHGLLSLPILIAGYARTPDWTLDVHVLLTTGTASTLVAVLLGLLIGHLKDLREELARQARTDALTGLLNRAAFMRDLDRALGYARRKGTNVAVAIVDLDRFKNINDTHGHDVGDEVLQLLGRRMRSELAPLGTWARLGGDEFLVRLTDPRHAEDAPGVIRNTLEAPLHLRGMILQVGASVGVSVYSGDGDATSLLRTADQVMYGMKRADQP
ncbi:diguanylate cyclase domain-containing protein [Deinococcus yavapaiensis]|uniref:diguanylate cyclase domain-containing protein n=1 Tax=Deinococcus yavapaiensis TaxID=309889 RepID=UPI000DA23B55|nr:GGDEF domain-containing protein [Deinococcus yavapaiensis]